MAWMQPTLDSAMLGLHPDILQTRASSALQDPRADKRPNQSLLQFQQNQTVSCQPATLIQNQLFQHAESQQGLARSFKETKLWPKVRSCSTSCKIAIHAPTNSVSGSNNFHI
uniref:Uncharacterized protein n=1 Tax=Opuntia streptacantha TaxID=393608 RepID=A0A7C8ZNY8_OPUST